MSRIEDEQQPGRLPQGAERDTEPRLLTRSNGASLPVRKRSPSIAQHEPETNLAAWAGRPPSGMSLRNRRVAWGIAGMLAAVCLLISGWVALLRHAATASLPQLDGALIVPGLHAAVTVTRDTHGVPSITANTLDDLLFAQGYVTASDRLWQMDALRRHAAGDLAEVLGSSLLEHDRRQRVLALRATADRAVARLPPDQLAELEAYARGVNRYLETHRGTLPLEFRLLAYSPAPWTPRDSLLILLSMFEDMSTRFPDKLNREAFATHLPANLLADLYPVGSWRDLPPAAQDHSISAPHPVELIPLDPSQARLVKPQKPGTVPNAAPKDLLAVKAALTGTAGCPDCRAGSNNWAVSGSRTVSGKPLLANDMHLNLGIPDIWYEAALHTSQPAATGTAPQNPASPLDVVGFTLPGLPFVVVGRNQNVAWGVTNLGADVQDLRIEHLRGTGNGTEYQQPDGTWTLAGHRTEHIRVRGGMDQTLDLLTTTQKVGETSMEVPVISPLFPSEHRALSLAWTAYDSHALTLPLLAVNTAATGAALQQAFMTFGGPTLNLVWADAENHIGYHAIGLVPVRGPAVQHPRSQPPSEAPPPEAPPVSEEDEGGAALALPPEASQSQSPVLMPVVFLLPSRHAAARPVSPRTVRYPAARRAAPIRSAHRRSRHAELPAAAMADPNDATPAPAPAALAYTIGLPIPSVPVDALAPAASWSGYIPYDALPTVTDPAGGVLATANSRITPKDYPWAVTDDWSDPFRTERIYHLLSHSTALTPEAMLGVANDVYSGVDQAMGQRVAYALDHASAAALGSDAHRLHQAADLLRSWDGQLLVASPAGAVLTAVRDSIWLGLLRPQIAAHDGQAELSEAQLKPLLALYTWGERTTALELLLQNQPARWLPHGVQNWSDFLAGITEQALERNHAPADLSRWSYGSLHPVEIVHPILGDHRWLAHLLGIEPGTGQHPVPGDFTTVKAIGLHFGPSERFVANLAADLQGPQDGNGAAALGNLTTGESGDGHSPWFLDQFGAWLHGTSFPLPTGGTPAAHTLHLLPGGAS